jgi:hypothetical protein
MPQADLTLNLLQSSRRYPKLSAHSLLNKAFNFLSTPLALPGTRAVAHTTPAQQANMAPHGVDGWYVGPSLDHYRCHKCYIPSTSQSWNVLIVDWFPHTVPFPNVNSDDYLRQTADGMLSNLRSRKGNQSPLAFGSTTKNAFIQIAQILRRATKQKITSPLTPVPELRVVQAPPIATPITPVAKPRVVPHTCSNDTCSHNATTNLGNPEATVCPTPRQSNSSHQARPGTSADSPLARKCSSPCPPLSPGRLPPQVRPSHRQLSHHTHLRQASIPHNVAPRPQCSHMVPIKSQ